MKELIIVQTFDKDGFLTGYEVTDDDFADLFLDLNCEVT